jgi:hypothetical protein
MKNWPCWSREKLTLRSSVSKALRLESRISSTISWVDWTFAYVLVSTMKWKLKVNTVPQCSRLHWQFLRLASKRTPTEAPGLRGHGTPVEHYSIYPTGTSRSCPRLPSLSLMQGNAGSIRTLCQNLVNRFFHLYDACQFRDVTYYTRPTSFALFLKAARRRE